jgi:hypothetical protein
MIERCSRRSIPRPVVSAPGLPGVKRSLGQAPRAETSMAQARTDKRLDPAVLDRLEGLELVARTVVEGTL